MEKPIAVPPRFRRKAAGQEAQKTPGEPPPMPATAKQRNYIAVLMDDMGWHSEQMAVYAHEQGIDLVSMSMAQASGFIDGLKRLAHPVPESRQWPYETDLPAMPCDDLFGLTEQVCVDCGGSFRTSQPAERCALCASLRSGPVGAATVECPVCGVEHEVPVLAPHKICSLCALDPVLARANIDSDLEAAHIRAGEATIALNDALAAAHIDDRTRYAAVVEARKSGVFHGKHYTPTQLAAGWRKALAAGDGLSRLLAADDAQRAAEAALAQALNDGQVALAEIGKVQG